ncbi:MAG: Mov34/MPN/PAD-1 family protein [Bradymonadaceae bacterium]|nr:Mov34/MPN/PAD-1 family protein [Lujinxingiaceae bacterium]
MPWSAENLQAIVSWLEAAYPEEGCGLLLQDASGAYRVHTCENLANKYHAMDPESYPRTARDFYMLNPIEFVKAEDRNERVAAVFHSHPDVGDYFSAEDIAAAVLPRDFDDEPLSPSYPGTDYLVVSVRAGKADHATLFRFDDALASFVGVETFEQSRLGRVP